MGAFKRIISFFSRLILKLTAKRQPVHYIGGSESLPAPLPLEEEQKMVRLWAQGDECARAKLIEHNLRLVVYIAKKFESTPVGIEDLVSIGAIGLIKAVNTFDPEKKIKLATYASRCIENEILMYLRRNNKLRFEVSFEEPLNIDWDGNELLLSDILGTDPNLVSSGIESEVEKSLLRDALSQLSEREQRIMRLRFGLIGETERTQKEIADMMGISQSYISRLEKRIMKRLKKQISSVI
ncbi:MAG: RNA polymerase sporulation sigma factor SigE [Christensenellales bacterium]|jgi:RNA polymerase sporulation-specific sigma factor